MLNSSAPANIPPGEAPENEVEEDDFKYFQVKCGTFFEKNYHT